MTQGNLEHRIRRLEDESEIRSLIQSYGRAVDWMSAEELDPVFFDDAQIDYGAFGGEGAPFKRTLQEVEENFPRRWHFTGSIQIKWVDDDTVEAESSQIAGSSVSADLAADYSLFFGWYLDRLERRDSRWGISRRKHLLSGLLTGRDHEVPAVLAQLNILTGATPSHGDFRNFLPAGGDA